MEVCEWLHTFCAVYMYLRFRPCVTQGSHMVRQHIPKPRNVHGLPQQARKWPSQEGSSWDFKACRAFASVIAC